jgi:hypothetical protein
VEYFSIVGQGTGTEHSENAAEAAVDPMQYDQGSPSQVDWEFNSNSSNASNQSTPPGSPAGQDIQFATPPTGESVDSEGRQMRFRTINNINETTDPSLILNTVGCAILLQRSLKMLMRL